MKRIAALLAAVLLLASPASVAAYDPSVLPYTQRYLADRVRVERGQTWYSMSTRLVRASQQRSAEISVNFRHRVAAYWSNGITCPIAEIIGWTTIGGRRAAVEWMIAAWKASPLHVNYLLNTSGKWRRYGVGATYRNGNWYLVVGMATGLNGNC